MFPTARIGDTVTHDMLVPSGVISVPMGPPTVIIENLPRAVVGDQVVCTGAITGGIVHPPMPPLPLPPISKGCTTVWMNGKPAGRWLIDIALCGTFLGDMKMAATRTVFIGTPA